MKINVYGDKEMSNPKSYSQYVSNKGSSKRKGNRTGTYIFEDELAELLAAHRGVFDDSYSLARLLQNWKCPLYMSSVFSDENDKRQLLPRSGNGDRGRPQPEYP